MADERQGIVHIIGPEQGFTLPGTVCVCGDSHTATHGAFGALAFGIGTSEVEHVLASQVSLNYWDVYDKSLFFCPFCLFLTIINFVALDSRSS